MERPEEPAFDIVFYHSNIRKATKTLGANR